MSIEVKNLVKAFEDRRVIDDVSFKVADGETLAIVGFSGSGKSTILKLICGLLTQDSGEIITSNGEIAMVFQYSALFDSLNVADNISFALHERKELRKKYTEKQIRNIVAEKLELVGLKGIERKFPSELSGGETRRMAIARALIKKPRIILADEPTGDLDDENTRTVFEFMKSISENGASVIVVTHETDSEKYADRVFRMNGGILSEK